MLPVTSYKLKPVENASFDINRSELLFCKKKTAAVAGKQRETNASDHLHQGKFLKTESVFIELYSFGGHCKMWSLGIYHRRLFFNAVDL